MLSDHPADTDRLNPAGLLQGVLGKASASWPGGDAIAWEPPHDATAIFPGYDRIELIGRGGMGAVYAARQISLDRPVALKLLPPALGKNAPTAERFRREAMALAKLSHPNIVAVYDFGETTDGAFFFAMERVDGADLRHLIHQGGLPLPRALDVIRQVCDALEFAHGQGFVHRDIKPANILVDAEGRVKVSDFGLARIIGEESLPDGLGVSLDGGHLGTPEYTAPEQRNGSPTVDHRADIYSLGVTLYELLTGSLPQGVATPPSERADVSTQMDRVVFKAMHHEPEKRQQRASEVKAEVEKAAVKFRRWPLGVAAVGLLCLVIFIWPRPPRSPEKSLGKESVSTVEATEVSRKGVWKNSLGMDLVTTISEHLFFAASETSRAEFAASNLALETAKVFFPNRGDWVSADGNWQNLPLLDNQTPNHAVVGISADEATAFCQWLTKKEQSEGRIGLHDRYRLPTATEWAAAAGEMLKHEPAGRPPATVEIATAGLRRQTPAKHGLYDMGGNVVEWTCSPGTKPNEFLACGYGWANSTPTAIAVARSYNRDVRGVALGFRVVLEKHGER